MAYISSKQKKSDSNATADSTTWVTVCETGTINMVPGTNNRALIQAGWHVTAGVLAGDVRVVIHNNTTDIELGVYQAPLGTSDRTALEEHYPAVSPDALHKAKIQIRAGSALSTTSIDAGDAWIKMTYVTT